MTTEQGLWATLTRHCPRDLAMHRIETGTQLGVADVEYVGAKAHGWVELKVGVIGHRYLRLGHVVTAEQAIWLLEHNRPRIHLHSWLLVGIHAPNIGRQWQRFLLGAPTIAALMAVPRPEDRPTWAELRDSKLVHLCPSAAEVLRIINRGGSI